MACELCRIYENREIRTELYYENSNFIIVDCLTCHVPLVVVKHHDPWRPGEKEKVERLRDKLFPGRGIRWLQRRLEHPHCHIEGTEIKQ